MGITMMKTLRERERELLNLVINDLDFIEK